MWEYDEVQLRDLGLMASLSCPYMLCHIATKWSDTELQVHIYEIQFLLHYKITEFEPET